MILSITRRGLLAATACCALAAPGAADAATAKNVMLFVSDGASWGTWDMASYWEHGQKGMQPYDGFSVKLGMTTEPLGRPGYDPAAAWDTTPTGDGDHFAGYKTIKQNYTDSAAAGTALATGRKTTNGRISADENGAPLTFITQEMKDAGKATGVVSSVPFSHATPAAFGAQNASRNNYGEIASQMINDGVLDLIMGGGNPEFGDSGESRAPRFNRISEADWTALNGPDAPMTLIQTKADFEALADGSLAIDGRVIGLPQVGDTLQLNRDPAVVGTDPTTPSGRAYTATVPSLKTMTEGALNHLGKDEDGMFLMVEGGAVDWAAHANSTPGIIEEQVDFNHAVAAAVKWVEANSSWDETLMIVLTDHGNAMPMGPDSDTIPFQPIQNNGAGNLPGVLWHYGTHTTENTLMWAQGAGSDMLYDMVIGEDPYLASILGFNDGRYVDITGVNMAMRAAAGLQVAAPIPLPGAVWMLGSAFVMLAGTRRMRRRA
jgi:alkaline phosphatase